MLVRFSVRKHPSKPGDFLRLYRKSRGTYTFSMLADDIVHSTSLTRADVIGVLTALMEHTAERLLDGYNVQFADFGVFNIQLDTQMIPAGTSVGNGNLAKMLIKDYKIRFLPHIKLRNKMRVEAEIQLIK
jgi:nucleoid DNA-binding protein